MGDHMSDLLKSYIPTAKVGALLVSVVALTYSVVKAHSGLIYRLDALDRSIQAVANDFSKVDELEADILYLKAYADTLERRIEKLTEARWTSEDAIDQWHRFGQANPDVAVPDPRDVLRERPRPQ